MLRSLKAFVLHPQGFATGAVFAFNSMLFGSWVSHIPEVKLRLGMSEAQLGLVLLGLPIGVILSTAVSGWMLTKVHPGKATLFSIHLLALFMGSLVFAPSMIALAALMVLAGAAGGLMNVAANICVTATEKAYNLTIMAACHGMYSLGGLIGAATAGWLISMGVNGYTHMAALTVLIMAGGWYITPYIMSIPQSISQESALFVLPTKALILLSAMGFCLVIGEGAVADWSAVFLRETLGSAPSLAAWGYAGYSFAMATGRFYGDALIPRIGGARILRLGGLIAAGGMTLAITTSLAPLAIFGFTLVGIGLSCVVPVLYTTAARMPGFAPGVGIAAVSTFSFMGFMLGPPMIGLLAEEFGLRIGLAFVAVLALLATGLSFKARI